jgi:hypothetical protein
VEVTTGYLLISDISGYTRMEVLPRGTGSTLRILYQDPGAGDKAELEPLFRGRHATHCAASPPCSRRPTLRRHSRRSSAGKVSNILDSLRLSS